jgi:hypothetical protein
MPAWINSAALAEAFTRQGEGRLSPHLTRWLRSVLELEPGEPFPSCDCDE